MPHNPPRDEGVSFRAGLPVTGVSNPPSPPSDCLDVAIHGLPIIPTPTTPPNYTPRGWTITDLQVAMDGPAIFLLPHHSKEIGLEASAMDRSSRPLSMAYYPDWVAGELPPERVDFSRYDWLDFAFAMPNARFGLEWDDDDAPRLLSRLVSLAHGSGTMVKLSIGGWTGSRCAFSFCRSASFTNQLQGTSRPP